MAVSNEILRAYNELRDRESKKLYHKPFATIVSTAKNNSTNSNFKNKVKVILDRFPMYFSEAKPY